MTVVVAWCWEGERWPVVAAGQLVCIVVVCQSACSSELTGCSQSTLTGLRFYVLLYFLYPGQQMVG